MKRYKLKEEAKPFFKDEYSSVSNTAKGWDEAGVRFDALEEVYIVEAFQMPIEVGDTYLKIGLDLKGCALSSEQMNALVIKISLWASNFCNSINNE